MKRIAAKLLFASAVAVSGASSLAQTCEGVECESPPPPPAPVTAACSPGYFKNHVSRWCNVTCPSGFMINQCTDLLSALYSTGSGAGILKNAAATYINSMCYVTREASPCEED
jgi:hypothetical protein